MTKENSNTKIEDKEALGSKLPPASAQQPQDETSLPELNSQEEEEVPIESPIEYAAEATQEKGREEGVQTPPPLQEGEDPEHYSAASCLCLIYMWA